MTLEEDTAEIEAPEVIDAPVEPQEGEEQEAQTEEEGPLVVQIGDEAPEEEDETKAPEWVRDLRKRDRENQKRIKELEAQLNKPADKPAIGPKPTLLDDDIDGDEEIYEQRLLAWHDANRKAEQVAREAEAQAKAIEEAWQAKVASYNEAKTKLPVADFDDAEAFVQDTFDTTQQGLLIKVAKDAPTLVYALGKNPKKATELAAIKDYAEFVAEAVRLEMSVKTTRKPATAPEKAVNVPTGTGVASTDNTLERLRAEAEKTGDYTKVMQYKKGKRA